MLVSGNMRMKGGRRELPANTKPKSPRIYTINRIHITKMIEILNTEL
jgi:hypothetical protein